MTNDILTLVKGAKLRQYMHQHCVNIEMCAKDQSRKPTLRVNANISRDSQSLEFSNAICGHHFHCLLEW